MHKIIRLVPLIAFFILILVYGCKKDPNSTGPATGLTTAPAVVIPYPYDSFIGTYHVTGYSQKWEVNNSYPHDTIDTYYTISYGDPNTLVMSGNTAYYQPQFDTLHYYTFAFPTCCAGFNHLVFHKPFDDSVFITADITFNPAYGTNYYLHGVKTP